MNSGDERSLVKKRKQEVGLADKEIPHKIKKKKERCKSFTDSTEEEADIKSEDKTTSPNKDEKHEINDKDERSLVKMRKQEMDLENTDLPHKINKRKEHYTHRFSNSTKEEADIKSDDETAPASKDEKHEIKDILKDITDLNEPSCMDKILMYLEEIKDEDYLFMELLVERLHGETITWEQPWYQQSNSLSRPLKDAPIEKQSESYRTDTICKYESDKIQENWNEFKKLYEVPDKLICLARWRNKDKSRLPNTPEERARRFVVAYLARGLQRTIYQVFRHIMTSFGGSIKGAYSSDEEKIMKLCFMHHPNHSVSLLSMVLSREPRGIYKRLQQMFHGKPEKKKIRWTLPLATRFLRLLLKYTHMPLEELKYKKIEKSIWLKLEKKFDHHYIYLQNFWYGSLHVQVFVKENLKVNKLRKQVFKKLKSSAYQVWTDIRWKDLVKQFPDGLTHRFLYQISRGVVCKITDYLKKPLTEISNTALDRLRKHRYRKRRLKMLQFNENGELEVVVHTSSNLSI